MFASLWNYSYERMNIPDYMHNLSRVFIWILNLLVGKKMKEADYRKWCQINGVFKRIWATTPVFLDPHFTVLLRETSVRDIESASRNWCLRWWRICKKTPAANTSIATLRQQIIDWREQLQTAGAKLTIERGMSKIFALSRRIYYILLHDPKSSPPLYVL